MSLPPGFLDELRGRLSLAQVVARKVVWDARRSNPARGDYWAPCPFHQERTASFHVDDVKGYYYCFGCHAKGDAIAFLRESEGMGFMEAVETLAREAGLALPERMPQARAAEDRSARLVAVMEAALAFYRLQLGSAAGRDARAYLERRGLAPATCERFALGFAPPGWTALLDHLSAQGHTVEEMAAAGLVHRREDGRPPCDRFRNRIIFPIRDGRGRVIAFGGRSLDPREPAKYYNSPETPLFDKGRVLFNLPAARAAARSQPLLVVEGYMDVIALVQAGLEAAVAPLGTAITEAQLEAVWRIAPEPHIALDGDAAGMRAAYRLIDLALPKLAAGRALRFVLLPGGQDPDDVLRTGGRAAMEALIAGSQPIVELLWRRETEGRAFDSPERRAALDARLKSYLARIVDPAVRAHTAAAFRERRERLLGSGRAGGMRGRRREIASGRLPAPPLNGTGATAATRASLVARGEDAAALGARLRESAILFGLINHPDLAPEFEERLERMTFLCPDLDRIRAALLSCLGEHLPQPVGEGLPAESQSLAERLSRRLGRDPRGALLSVGPLRIHPHLRIGGDRRLAALAIEQEMVRHAAAFERALEVREAEAALAGEADEALTWRLRQVAEAGQGPPLVEPPAEAAAEIDLSRHLQALIDRKIWKKPRKR